MEPKESAGSNTLLGTAKPLVVTAVWKGWRRYRLTLVARGHEVSLVKLRAHAGHGDACPAVRLALAASADLRPALQQGLTGCQAAFDQPIHAPLRGKRSGTDLDGFRLSRAQQFVVSRAGARRVGTHVLDGHQHSSPRAFGSEARDIQAAKRSCAHGDWRQPRIRRQAFGSDRGLLYSRLWPINVTSTLLEATMPAIVIRPPASRTPRVRTTPSLSDNEYDEWQAEMEMLRELLSVRPKECAGLSPSDRWSGTINTRIYALVRRYRAEGKLCIIHRIIASLPHEPLKTELKDNIFYLALYAAREDGEITMLTDKNLSRFARQMSYADRHDVQPEIIIGFVYQQGSERDLAYKLKAGEYEPWFFVKEDRPVSE